MTPRPGEVAKVDPKLEKLRERLAAAEAESKRVAAKRAGTGRKLDDLGRQLAGLKSDLAKVRRERAEP